MTSNHLCPCTKSIKQRISFNQPALYIFYIGYMSVSTITPPQDQNPGSIRRKQASTYESFEKEGFAHLITNQSEVPYLHEKRFLSKVDVTKGPTRYRSKHGKDYGSRLGFTKARKKRIFLLYYRVGSLRPSLQPANVR